MMLNKLTGTSVGLTASDMFVIGKPAMLTVSILYPVKHTTRIVQYCLKRWHSRFKQSLSYTVIFTVAKK